MQPARISLLYFFSVNTRNYFLARGDDCTGYWTSSEHLGMNVHTLVCLMSWSLPCDEAMQTAEMSHPWIPWCYWCEPDLLNMFRAAVSVSLRMLVASSCVLLLPFDHIFPAVLRYHLPYLAFPSRVFLIFASCQHTLDSSTQSSFYSGHLPGAFFAGPFLA